MAIRTALLASLFIVGVSRIAALAQEPDKSGFHLFNPTPRELMREMSTDRPDSTESAFTVDAGHVQVELSFFEFERKDDGPRTDTVSIAPVNLKLGLLNNLDVQFILTPYLREREVGAGSVSGTGDLTVRTKLNLVGNDGGTDGDFALAVMPFITLPTGSGEVSSDEIEGGLIVPWSFTLAQGVGLSMMLEFDAAADADGSGRHLELVHTASLAFDLVETLGIFVEYAGRAIFKGADPYEATFNTGLTLALTPDIQLDGGVRIGLTESAPDYAVFAGISLRF